jgi:hypothetical protein
MPKRRYVYAIYVDGVRRYIGKGSSGRMYAHMKEADAWKCRLFRRSCRLREWRRTSINPRDFGQANRD